MAYIVFKCGCRANVLDHELCDMHKATEELIEAIHGLLDGLDANIDGRDGLTQKQWDDRIAFAWDIYNKAIGRVTQR